MFVKLYFLTLPVFFAIDLLWLGVVAKQFYGKYLGFLMSPSPNWAAAVLFYLLFIAGLVFFVIQPAVERGQWGYALGAGIFFGLITYATYDLTNLATIKQWPFIVTVVDLMWGMVLSGSVSVIAFFAARRIGM
ncbi:DUF2177 family protein [Candidatus Gottesmanbacteria bacterium]|nr:DUF2177 family protein [Candidatus Gottesmanbacteria bacterium]